MKRLTEVLVVVTVILVMLVAKACLPPAPGRHHPPHSPGIPHP